MKGCECHFATLLLFKRASFLLLYFSMNLGLKIRISIYSITHMRASFAFTLLLTSVYIHIYFADIFPFYSLKKYSKFTISKSCRCAKLIHFIVAISSPLCQFANLTNKARQIDNFIRNISGSTCVFTHTYASRKYVFNAGKHTHTPKEHTLRLNLRITLTLNSVCR